MTTPFQGWFVIQKLGFDIQSTCLQNLTTLALAVPEISLGPQNLKWVT